MLVVAIIFLISLSDSASSLNYPPSLSPTLPRKRTTAPHHRVASLSPAASSSTLSPLSPPLASKSVQLTSSPDALPDNHPDSSNGLKLPSVTPSVLNSSAPAQSLSHPPANTTSPQTGKEGPWPTAITPASSVVSKSLSEPASTVRIYVSP
jgi:hypothetical protein